ncbi:PseG/SpsG family protein [Neobacillus sp. NRS-1170]|uniref:PseG/SpsG family protein n=1 Tax=Neobacillus sp. NRS-1170 TaxID=3233898 RepID=UPI003D2A5470
MKVYILTEAGSMYGYGHLVRCSSLYSELSGRGIDVELIINGDHEAVEVVKNKKYRIVNWLSIDFLSQLLHGEVYTIVDSYLANFDIYHFISAYTDKSLFIDDNMRLNYPKGIVVNPSIYGKELNYPKNTEIEYLLGPEYVILRDSFLKSKREGTNNQVKEVLITLGGADIRNLTPKILTLFKKEYPYLIKNVVVGKGFTNIKDIENIDDQNVTLYYNVDGNQMKDLMLKSDITITAAGQTIHELIKTETPFIPIQVIDNQRNNVKAILTYNLVNRVLHSDDEDVMDKLSAEIKFLLHEENRLFLINNLHGLIDGAGSARIVSKLLEE